MSDAAQKALLPWFGEGWSLLLLYWVIVLVTKSCRIRKGVDIFLVP